MEGLLGVQVSPGNHPHTETATSFYSWTGKKYTYSCTSVDVGTKVNATSPVITVGGKRWSPAHPYERAALKISSLDGYIKRQRVTSSGKTEYGTLEGGIPGSPALASRAYKMPFASANGVPGAIPTNLWNRIITELLNKAGHRQWSMGEDLAEAHKTVNHLARTVSDLARFLLDFRRGHYTKAFKRLGVSKKGLGSGKTASERWLEYQYGWLPLVNSVYDASQVASKGLSRPSLIRVTRRISPYSEFDFSANSYGAGTGANPGRKVVGHGQSSAQGYMYFRLKSEFLSGMSQLGLVNPAEIAWALVPYSFVVDWVLPVQNVLQAMTDTLGLTFVDGAVTYRVEGDCEITQDNHSALNSAAGWALKETRPHYRVEQFGMRRIVITDPTPGLYVKNPFSSTHVISAIALLRQLRRG